MRKLGEMDGLWLSMADLTLQLYVHRRHNVLRLKKNPIYDVCTPENQRVFPDIAATCFYTHLI